MVMGFLFANFIRKVIKIDDMGQQGEDEDFCYKICVEFENDAMAGFASDSDGMIHYDKEAEQGIKEACARYLKKNPPQHEVMVSTPNEKNTWVGYNFIKKNTKDGILTEIWQDVGNNESNPSNQWKKVESFLEKPYEGPIWVDTLEEAMKLKSEGKTNVHIKSKPTFSDPFINEKGEICIRHTDEHDHMWTIRCDNPMNLNAQEAKEVMDDLTKGFRKEDKKDGIE